MLRVLCSPVNTDGDPYLHKQHNNEYQPGFDEDHPFKVQFLHFLRENKDKDRQEHAEKNIDYGGYQEPLEILILLVGNKASNIIDMNNKGYLEDNDEREDNHCTIIFRESSCGIWVKGNQTVSE